MNKKMPADCDLCGRSRQLFQVWYQGHMETWACAECLGREEELDHEINQQKPTFEKTQRS